MGLFNKDLKIGAGERYDANRVAAEGVSKEEAAKDKKKLIKVFQAFDLNGDNTLDAVELARAMDYIDSLDEDGNGNDKVSKKELKQGAAQLNEQLGLEGKDEIKARDIKKFIKNIQKSTEGDATISRDELFKYIDDESLDAQNIKKSEVVDDGNGGKKYVISYDNETQVTLNGDGSYQVKTEDEQGTVSTQYHNKDKKLLKETNVYENNDTEVTDFDPNQEAEVPLKTVSTRNNGAVRSELNYVDGKPATETVTSDGGATVENYEYRDEEAYLVQKTENKGTEDQQVSRYAYNQDGTISATVTNKDGKAQQVLDEEHNVLSETVNLNNGTTIKRVYNDDRSRSQYVTDKNNRQTYTEYNADGKRLQQSVLGANGRQYDIKYDGNGNTEGIIVQFKESPADIAKKFGCSVDDLIALNKDKLQGSGKGAYFNVGDSVKVPGELDADAKALQGRDSREQALAKYEQHQAWVRRDKQLRKMGLKNYKRAGEKFKYGNEEYTILGTLKNRERTLVQNKKGEVFVASWDNKILKDEYVDMTNLYDSGKKVKLANGKEYVIVQDRGDRHGRKIAVNHQGQIVTVSGGSSQTDMGDRVILRDDYLQASDLRDAGQAKNTLSGGDKITYVKDSNGKVWYWNEETGSCLVKGQHTAMVKKESDIITNQVYNAAKGAGTDEEALMSGVQKIYSREILENVNISLAAKDSDYETDGSKMPIEALIYDEENHGNARRYFNVLIKSGAMTPEESARTIKRELEHEVHGGIFGYTSTKSLNDVLNMVPDRETRLELEKQFAESHPGLKADDGSLVRAYIAGDGWNPREVDQFDANLVKNGAYDSEHDQQHRDAVIGRLVFDYDNDEALNIGLDAVDSNPDSADYINLNKRAAQENKERGFNSQFKNQESIQTYLAGRSDDGVNVDVEQLSAWNNSLYKEEKPARVVAEESMYNVRKGDVAAMFESSDPAVYNEMEKMIANGDVTNVKNIQDAYNTAMQASKGGNQKLKIQGNAILSGKIDFTNEEIKDYCIKLMHGIDENAGRGASTGESAAFTNESDAQKAMLKSILTHNPELIPELKKQVQAGNFVRVTTIKDPEGKIYIEPIKTDTKAEHLQLLNNIKGIADEAVFYDENGNKITDPEQIEEITASNMQKLEYLRRYTNALEREFKRGVDEEGVLSDMANGLSEYSGWGTDRSDVATRYKEAKLLLTQMEAAAKGKLRDSSGNVITMQSLAQNVIDMENGLAETNADYKSTIATGKMGIVLAPVVVASTIASGGAAAAGWGTIGTGLLIGGATFVTEAGLGMLEMSTSETGNTAQARAENFQRALVDGGTVFAGAKFMKAAQTIKAANPAIQTVKRVSAVAAGDISVGAGGEYLLKGDVTVEGVAYSALFSVGGNLLALRPAKAKVDLEVPANENLLTIATKNGNNPKGVAPENAVGNIGPEKFEAMVDQVSEQVKNASDAELAIIKKRGLALRNREQSHRIQHLVEDEQILRQLDNETNLGDLHKLEKKVSQWTDETRRKGEILEDIALRRAELQETGTYTIAERSIDPQIKANAEAALAQAKKHLDPTQINAVKQYVETITDPAELNRVVANLKDRGMKLSSGRLKAAIDAKYAELNVPKNPVEPTTPMTGDNEVRINDHEIRVTGSDRPSTPAGGTYTATAEDFARFRPAEPEVHTGSYANVVDGTPAPKNAGSGETYVSDHEVRLTGDNTPAQTGATYDATNDFMGTPTVTTRNAQVRKPVGTPRLDRLNPRSGRLGGQAKSEITAEVTNFANSASTTQELQALKAKVQDKIYNPELRANLEKIIDNAQANLNARAAAAAQNAAANTAKPITTPRLDRINPRSGRLGGLTRQTVTQEIQTAAANATTREQLQSLKDKVQNHIADNAFRQELNKIIDDAVARLV